jgi:perosamine synthetase
MIPVTDVRITPSTHNIVASVLESGRLSQGPWVRTLEQVLAETCGTHYAVAVCNGTAGLHLALAAAGVGPGDEVIVPAFTFAATAHAVQAVGAKPVFCDVDDHWLLDWDHARLLVTDRTKAIVPVHLYGQQCDLRLIGPIRIVEDAAQAIGLSIRGGVISLYGSKTIPAGEGGVVVTDSERDWHLLKAMRNHGMSSPMQFQFGGLNYRMTELQAAVAVGQLTQLDSILAMRRHNASVLWDAVGSFPVELCQPVENVWHQFTLGVSQRDVVRERLHDEGIETRIYYPQALPDFDWLPDADTPNARRAARRVMSIPVHEHLTAGQLDFIASTVARVLEETQ